MQMLLPRSNQMEETEQSGITENEQAIEFTTQDGQKVRLVASYHVDPMTLLLST